MHQWFYRELLEGERSDVAADNEQVDMDVILGHLRDGYQSGQETIRAMDTKVSILTGLSVFGLTIAGGAVGAAWQFRAEHSETIRNLLATNLAMFLLGLAAMSCLVSILSGLFSCFAAVNSLRARNRGQFTKLPATIIFPFMPRHSGKVEDDEGPHARASDYYQRMCRHDLTLAGIREEYVDQIQNIGAILTEKSHYNSKASRWFLVQLATLVALLVLMVLAFVGSFHSIS